MPNEFPPHGLEQPPPLVGTVTIVMAEGRRMMRLSRELPSEHFRELLADYQRFLSRLLEEMGGRQVEAEGDTVAAAFATAKEAALASVAAQRAVASHAWPHGLSAAISVGVHSGETGIGWLDPMLLRCSELCDAAEGGQIFLSPATANLLGDQDVGELVVRDIGEPKMRRNRGAVRAYELVFPSADETTA